MMGQLVEREGIPRDGLPKRVGCMGFAQELVLKLGAYDAQPFSLRRLPPAAGRPRVMAVWYDRGGSGRDGAGRAGQIGDRGRRQQTIRWCWRSGLQSNGDVHSGRRATGDAHPGQSQARHVTAGWKALDSHPTKVCSARACPSFRRRPSPRALNG